MLITDETRKRAIAILDLCVADENYRNDVYQPATKLFGSCRNPDGTFTDEVKLALLAWSEAFTPDFRDGSTDKTAGALLQNGWSPS